MTGEGAKLWVLGEICLFRNVTCAHLVGRGIPRHTYPLLIRVGGGGGGGEELEDQQPILYSHCHLIKTVEREVNLETSGRPEKVLLYND